MSNNNCWTPSSYVDTELAKKSDVHSHPYKPSSYVPAWSEITNKPTNATKENGGFMSSEDKSKLDGIQNNANNYIHPSTHNANMILFSDGETFQNKLNNGTLKGAKGDRGEQGIQGVKGDKGDKGDKGEQGKDGLTTSITVNGKTYSHSNGNITLPNYPTVNENNYSIWSGTQKEFEAIKNKDSNTIYMIKE